MQHRSSHLLSVSLLFLFLFLSLFSSMSQALPYSDCAAFPYTCGSANFALSFPFQVDGRKDYCSYPGFYLNCTKSNGLTININNKNYQLLSIDYINNLINIVDIDFIHQSCPHPYRNSSIDTDLFQYSEQNQNLTLYLNCTESSSTSTYSEIACLKDSYFRVENGTTDVYSGRCSSTVWVPLVQEAGKELENGSLGFQDALKRGFFVKWTSSLRWCSTCLSSDGYCGYSSSSNIHTCFCADGRTSIDGSCLNNSNDQGNSNSRRKIIIGVCVGLASFLIVSSLLIFWFRSHKKISDILFLKKKAKHVETIEAFLKKYGSLATKRYTYSQLRKITKSFSEKLGQGGYGSVYKGKLLDGRLVAVKVLSETKCNGEDFINEVAAIWNTSHVNVVSLRGFCVEGSKRALIYDFMPNGSLEKYIYSEKISAETSLGWEKLYNIAIGIARGLEYLHQGSNTRIVHFDIKPHNILLDQDFCPKISDFGMAKLCPPKHSTVSMYGTRGTVGYIAPEVFSRVFGVVSSKSDVYSYGMMVLEMFVGKRSLNAKLESVSETYFPQCIYQHLDVNDDLVEYRVTDETGEFAKKMLNVGFWCIQTMPENRPSMSRVVDMLEGSLYDLPIPPKPILSPPSVLRSDSYTKSSLESDD